MDSPSCYAHHTDPYSQFLHLEGWVFSWSPRCLCCFCVIREWFCVWSDLGARLQEEKEQERKKKKKILPTFFCSLGPVSPSFGQRDGLLWEFSSVCPIAQLRDPAHFQGKTGRRRKFVALVLQIFTFLPSSLAVVYLFESSGSCLFAFFSESLGL